MVAKTRNIELEVTEEVVTTPAKNEKGKVKKAEKSMGKDDFLEAVTGISIPVEKKAAKKNGIPTIALPAEMKKSIDEIVAAKKAMKEAKAVLETREAEVISHVMPIYEKDAFDGNFHKSYYICGEEETITFVTSDKFSAPTNDEIPELQEILKDKFEDSIKKEVEVKLRPEVFSNKQLQRSLLELIPKERFSEFFISETRWEICEGFDQKRFSFGRKIYDRLANIIKQAKASLK